MEPLPTKTHDYVKRLTENGMSQDLAETVVDIQIDILRNVASKSDIEALGNTTNSNIEALGNTTKSDFEKILHVIEMQRKESDAKFEKVFHLIDMQRKEFDSKISDLKTDLIKWFFGISFGISVMLVGIVLAAVSLPK